MPKFSYQCEKCLSEISKIFQKRSDCVDQILCESPNCDGTMVRCMSNPQSHTEFVLGDKYRNKHVLLNVGTIMKKRSRDYQKKYQLGEMIEKQGKDNLKDTTFFNDDGTVKSELDEK